MFNKFIKKSSKFFALVLTATLAFTPLSYGATPTTFADLGLAISDGTVTPQVIGLESSIEAETTDTTLGTQGATELTIKGDNFSVSGAGTASGFEIGEGQSATVVDTTFEKFTKAGDGSVISNTNGKLLIENSKFTANSASGKGGALYNTGTMTINNSEFSGNTANEVANDVYNDGELSFLSGTTTMEGGIAGTGRTVINGGTLVLGEEAVLEQSYLEIGEGSSFAINVSSISITAQDTNPEIKNNGSLTLSTGTVESFSSKIAGTGTTTVNLGANVNMGSNSIEQSKLIVDEGSSLTAEIQNLKIQSTDNSGETPTTTPGTITNNGTITLVVGSNANFESNIVSDEGKDGALIFALGDSASGSASVEVKQDINQSTVTIKSTENNALTVTNENDRTITTSNLLGDGSLQNNGKLVLNLKNSDAYSLKSLTGVGTSSITVTEDAQDETTIGIFGATIQQDRLEFYGDKTLRLDGSTSTRAVAQLPVIEADIYNYMKGDSLHLKDVRQEGDFVNNTDAVAYFEENSSVSGTIYNNGGTLNIVSNDFVVENGITSENQAVAENILNIGDAENAAVVNSSTTISYQTITVSSGSLIMNNMVGDDSFDGSITNSSITVATDGLLEVNPENLEDLTAPVTNDGTVKYYGGSLDTTVVNENTITGSGELIIDGFVRNEEGTEITQNQITINDSCDFHVNANDVDTTAGTGIVNDGRLYLTGKDTVNTSTITASSEDKGVLTVSANELNNTAEIAQEDVNVLEDSTLKNNSKITVSSAVSNFGTIQNVNGTIDADIVVNFNDIYNEQGGVISSTNIINVGTIVSSGSIKATEITNEEGATIENYATNEDGEYEGGTIESDEITNSGTLISNASGVKALVSNTAKGVYDVMGGTVSYSVSGAASGGSVVNVKGDVFVDEDVFISQNAINLEDGNTLKLADESNLRTSTLNIGEGSTLDIANDETNDMNIEGINVADGITWNFNFDVDLEAQAADLLKNTNFGEGSTMNIGIINVLTDSDRTTGTNVQIADSFTNTDIQYSTFATTQLTYTVKQLTGEGYDDATWLSIMGEGYGGLPMAVYDSLALYLVTGDDEGNDFVTEWIDDGGVQNTLKADLAINALDSGKVLLSTNSLTGLKTDKYTLKINNEAESQELTIKGFENALTVSDVDGRLEVNNVVFSSNTGTAIITNEGKTVLNGVTFDDTNEATVDVLNNGELVLSKSSSTFTKGIAGTGSTTINGIAIDMGDGVLSQSRVEISDVEGSSLTVKVDNLKDSSSVATGLIMNHGELVLIGNTAADVEVASLETEIKGVGNTELQDKINVASNISQENINISENAEITVNDTASIKASTITVGNLAILTSNADNIITAPDGKIANEGIVEFTGGTNKNVIEGSGFVYISGGEVVNSTGTKIEQAYVEIQSNGGSLVANADDIKTTTTSGILNVGDLEFTGGTNENIIHGHSASGASGNLKISGDVINKDGMIIEQNSITINEGASLQANAYDLWIDDVIANAGELVFVGSDMVNTSTITGTGNLTIKDSLENYNDIQQTNIDIVGGTFEHFAEDDYFPKISATNISISTSATLIAHSEVVASDKITNNGLIIINVENEEEYEPGDESVKNNSVIDGSGELKLSSTTFATTASIKQSTITIADADSVLTGDVNNIVATGKIANEGLLVYTGEGINNNVIDGEGNLTISGTIENSTGTAISQNAIAVTEGNGFKTRADDITTTEGIENDGTLTFIGGTNNNEITMSDGAEGKLVVEDNLTNQANITQKEIEITGGDFENVRTSSITAEKITVADGSTLITDALDLEISDSITLSGEETVFNLKDESEAEIGATITGAGKIVKEGEGTVTLSGENSYTGTTTISGGAIEIVAADGISEETIYMDGGKLIINSDSEVELGNEIMGTDHNDVNIEVVGSTTTMTGTIYGNEDLVKTGEGVLDLQMETNGYAGDTIISSGTVIGTTKNINGKVTGSGAEDSAVEFYDAEGEVTLNEIADMGTFSKTGEATMTVTENFKALDANITAGTFIINNDASMGGSGNTFEVTNEMRVENASLQGYGDITVGDLIIGQDASFAPGNSTTTFKVDGNLIFENNGNYDVEFGQFDMDTEGHYNDNTQVTGTTTIGENATITLNNIEGKYYVHETIELINAGTLEDGYEYLEDNVVFNDNDARGLREGYDTRISTRVYTEGNVLKIDLERKKSEYSETEEFKRSHNEQEVTNAIDAISTGNDGEITTPLDAMEQLFYYKDTYDIDGLKAAFNDIGGVIHSNATNLTFFNTKAEHVYDKVKERTQDILPCKKAHSKVWGEYYYNNYSVDKDDNSPKHETNVNGFLVGYDMISAKNLTLGVTAGYGTSELKQAKDKATMNDINLGFYGGYENNKWLLKGMLLGGYEQYSIDRTIAFMDRTANSEHNGYSAALDLEAGYKISLNRKDSQSKHKVYLKPFIGAIGSYVNNEGYEEKNAESLNLKIEDYNALTAEARAGLELNGKVKKFGWYAKAGVRQLLTDKQNEIETSLLDFADETKMKIWSAENAQTTLTGGIGANYDLSENWNIFANGVGNFADVSTNYYANVGLMYKFGCPNNKKVTDEDVEKISAMLNDKITQEEMLKKDLAKKDKELQDAADREKELKDKVQKYEENVANIVTEEKATKMKQKTIKTFKLGEKPTVVFGTDQLNGNGKESLRQVAAELENYPDAEVLIEGHTDNVGSDEVNQRISENRAASVANALKKDYKVKNPIAVIGKGKKEPIASNDTAEGRAKNRRVEIILTTAE